MKTAEFYEKHKIKLFLASLDSCWHFSPMMNGFGKQGVPDIVACIRGRLVGIEVKRAGKSPTPLQEHRMQEIRDAGGIAIAGTADIVIPYLRANLT